MGDPKADRKRPTLWPAIRPEIGSSPLEAFLGVPVTAVLE
jgi:hypothetical protein